MSALSAEALDLADRHSLYADFAQGVADVVEAKWFYYRGDQFHGGFSLRGVARLC
jgi:hypothetical protein